MRGKRTFLLLVHVCLAAALFLPSLAEARLMQRTLMGVEESFVSVEGIPPSLEKHGLNAKQIKAGVEKMIREAGLRVLTSEEWRQKESRPCLSVEIRTYRYPGRSSEAGALYAYSVNVRFFQTVSLVRDPLVRTIAPTWVSESAMGIINEKNLMDIRDYVETFVAQFIKDHRLANEEKPAAAPVPTR